MTLSELFFRRDDRAIDQWKFSLLHAFHANFKHWFVYRERNDREPNGAVYEIVVLCDPVDIREF